MEYSRETRGDRALLKITGPLTVYEAAEASEAMLACFEEENGLILDLTDVQDCDTAGVQLLCAARKTAQNAGKPFAVTGASGPVKTAVTGVGLALDDIAGDVEGQ